MITLYPDILVNLQICWLNLWYIVSPAKKSFILQRIRHLFEISSQSPLYISKHLYTHLNCGFLNILYTWANIVFVFEILQLLNNNGNICNWLHFEDTVGNRSIFLNLFWVSSNVYVPVTMFRASYSSPTGLFVLLTCQVQSYFGVVGLSVSMSWIFDPRIVYFQLFHSQFSAYLFQSTLLSI